MAGDEACTSVLSCCDRNARVVSAYKPKPEAVERPAGAGRPAPQPATTGRGRRGFTQHPFFRERPC
jgi:hypothetical protein